MSEYVSPLFTVEGYSVEDLCLLAEVAVETDSEHRTLIVEAEIGVADLPAHIMHCEWSDGKEGALAFAANNYHSLYPLISEAVDEFKADVWGVTPDPQRQI
ncbi:hypothetical protein GYB14_22655 [bacterium]|nr:hypothetical protein [bacterium]